MNKVKIKLSVLMLSLWFLIPSFAQAELEQVNQLDPVELSSQFQTHKLKFDLQTPDADKYYIEITQDDGVDINLPDCRSGKSLRRFLCRLTRKLQYFFYKKTRVSKVQISLNGESIVHRKDFNWRTGKLVKEVILKEKNSLKVKVRGFYRTAIRLKIYSIKEKSNLPPSLELSHSFLDPDQLELRVKATDIDGDVVSGTIDFGDGSSLPYTTSYYQKYYAESGTYPVTVSVTDDKGLSTTRTRVVVVDLDNEFPGAIIEASQWRGSAPLTVDFNGSRSVDPDGEVRLFQWRLYNKDESDFEQLEALETSKTYNEPGVYKVSLEVEDNDFLIKKESVYVVVDEPLAPVPKINVTRRGLKDFIFDGTLSEPSQGRQIVSYRWTLGDGYTSKNGTKYWSYNDFGTYVVNLTVTDSEGGRATVSETITISENDIIPPYADFDWIIQEDSLPYEVYFFNLSYDTSQEIVSYQVDFGDGQVENFDATFGSVAHNYQAPGIYTVTMTVTDIGGLKSQQSRIIDLQNVVLPNIVLSGGPFRGQAPLTVSLDASRTTSPNGEITYYEWDLTDDGVYNPESNESAVTKVFELPGVYNVSVAAQDVKNRKAFSYFQIHVGNIPKASLDWIIQSDQAPYEVVFFSESESDGSPIVEYELDYGDGQVEVFDESYQYSVHNYQSPGVYNVSLKVTNAIGLSDEKTVQLDLQNVQLPNIVLGGGPFSGPAPLTVNFDASGTTSPNGAIVLYEWDLTDDGVYNPTLSTESVSQELAIPGNYRFSVAAQDELKRKSIHYFDIEVLEGDYDYKLNILASQVDSSNGSVQFTAQLSPLKQSSLWPVSGVTYEWDLGDGQRLIGEQVLHNYVNDGSFEVILKASIPNQGNVYASLSLKDVYVEQQINEPTFLIIGNNGPAPLNIQMEATNYANRNPEIKEFIWESPTVKNIPSGRSSFFTFKDEGSHNVSLTVVNGNGFSRTSQPQAVSVTGLKPPIFSRVESRLGANNGPDTDAAHKIYDLPSLVRFSSEKSFSQLGEKITTQWNMGGQTLKGKNIYFLVTDIGDYTIQAMLKDETGNTEIVTKGISVPYHICERGPGDNICPRFLSHKDNILPLSQSQWVIATGIQGEVLSRAEQIELYGRWLRIHDKTNDKYYNLSEIATLSGSDVVIKQSDLRDLGVDLTAQLEVGVSLYDDEQNLFQGGIYPIKLGLGNANLTVPKNALVNILSEENNYFRQVEAAANTSISLSDLPAGKYSVLTTVGGQTLNNAFRINGESSVSLDLNPVQTVLAARVQKNKTSHQIHYMTPQEANAFAKQGLSSYLSQYSPSNAVVTQSSKKGVSTNTITKTQSTSSTQYPAWTKQLCNDESPLHIPLSTEKEDEFMVKGVESWAVAHANFGDGNISGDFLDFQKIDQNSLKFKSGKRTARLQCFVNGNIHDHVNYYKFVEGKRCCSDDSCRDGLQDSYKYWGELASSNDSSPIHFKFYIKNPETGEETLITESSESFRSAADKMGLTSKASIAQYFGIADPSYGLVGIWAPTFWVDVPIPEKILNPELKIAIEGYPQEFSSSFTSYGFGCYLPRYDGYRPEIVRFEEYGKLSKNTDKFNFNDIQIENNSRYHGKKKAKGKFPLNWDAKNFMGSVEFKFDSVLPLEFEVSNGFGVSADRIKVNIKANKDSHDAVLTSEDFEVVAQKNLQGEKIDVYRLRLDMNNHKHKFIWNLSKTKSIGIISFDLEWDTIQGEVIEAETKKVESPVSYNLSEASTPLCSKGFYGNYNPFATPDFFRKYNQIDSIVHGGRCNDIGHPFGGEFAIRGADNKVLAGHSGAGHAQGVGIDLRYPNGDQAGSHGASGAPIDEYDRSGRKVQVDKVAAWISRLRSSYSDPQLKLDLQDTCSANSGLASCGVLADNSYDDASIRIFCHLESVETNFSEIEKQKYCGNFPKEEAIALSKNIQEIRESVDVLVTQFPRANIFIGTGWFEKFLIGGQLVTGESFVQYDIEMQKFKKLEFSDWQLDNVTPENGHLDHIHIDLY